MENNINVSALAQNIADQCKQFEESQAYRDMITKAVENLYTSAINDVFRWGKFPDLVKEALKNAMPENVGDFVDLAKYNTLMMSTLKQQWEESGIQNHAVNQLQDITKLTLENFEIPQFVLMSELFEFFIEENEESAAEENWEKPNILLRESENVSEYWDLGFEEEEEQTSRFSSPKTYGFQFKNCLEIRAIYTDRKDKEFKLHDGHKCYELYAGKVDGDILGKEIVNPRSKYEKLICALYFGNAYLVWDDFDPEDLRYPNSY